VEVLYQVTAPAAGDPAVQIVSEIARQGPLGIILAWFMLRLERKLEAQREADERLIEGLAELSKTVALHSELIKSLLNKKETT